jgi:hypothetical protein
MTNLNELTKSEQVDSWVGTLCIAIGRGEFRSTVNTLIMFYQQEAYERGVAEGLRQAKVNSLKTT